VVKIAVGQGLDVPRVQVADHHGTQKGPLRPNPFTSVFSAVTSGGPLTLVAREHVRYVKRF
jgi:hypothetical protein